MGLKNMAFGPDERRRKVSKMERREKRERREESEVNAGGGYDAILSSLNKRSHRNCKVIIIIVIIIIFHRCSLIFTNSL